MKHAFRAFMALTLALVVLCGCSQELTPEEAFGKLDMTKATISVSDLAATLADSLTFDDKPQPIETEIALILYNIDGMCEEIASYGSTGATAEAVLAVRCENAEKAKTVYDSLSTYRTEMADIYSRYNETESHKLSQSLLRCDGKYVVFCVSPDTAAAETVYRDFVLANAK